MAARLLHWPPKRQQLEYNASLVPVNGAEILCLCAGPVTSAAKDAAGIAFQTAVLKQKGLFVYPPSEEEAAAASAAACNSETNGASTPLPSTGSGDQGDQPPPGVSWKGSKKKKDKKKERGVDWYALLGLQNERWTATEKQLKDAYRKVCLEHHPDKRLANVTDEHEKAKVEDYFKQIQEAYGVLSDPSKRREFDSLDSFDDSLPLDCAPQDFFKVFGPAFRRNARWSHDPKVPDIGSESSPWPAVDKFYNFWFAFRSWREFPHPDEEDLEGAESREHRRWIERMNSKLREKAKKEEGRRLREFVEAAYKLDPRVVAKKAEDKAEKERVKWEKEASKRRAAEEAEAARLAQEAARLAAEEAEKAERGEAKKAREAAKRAVKKERQRLRLVCDGGQGVPRLISEDDVDKLISKLEPEQLMALNERLSAPGIGREEQAALTISALTGLSAAEAAEVAAKERLKQEAEQAAKENLRLEHERKMAGMREWTEEELRMMDKALNKFPQGTPRRWDAVTSYIRTRTLDEVLLMVKDKQGMSATRARAQEDFRSGMKKKAEVTCTADLRINAFTDVNVNLAGDAATTLMAAPGSQGAEEDAAPAPPTPAPDCNGSSSSTAPAAAPPTPQEAGDASLDDAAPASPSSLPGHTAAGTASSNGLVARPSKQAEAVDSLPGSAAPAGATPSPPSPLSQQPAAQPQPAVAATTTKPAAADKQSGKKTAAAGKAAAGKAAAGKAAAEAAAAPVPAGPTDSTPAAKAALTDKSGPKAEAGAVQASPVKAASPPAAAANGPSKAEGAGKAKPSVVVSADSGAWSEAQELALVQAMKQFGKELGTERWEKVAELVPGKSKAQCFKRFKELRDAFRAKKGGAAGDGDE